MNEIQTNLEETRGQAVHKLLTADWNGLKVQMEEERAIRKELKKMDWW